MKTNTRYTLSSLALAATPEVGRSPWGAADEIGRLNPTTAESRAAILPRDGIYESACIGVSLRLRGADGAPIHPIALPLNDGGES